MTVLWFIVWLIADNIDGHEPLLFDPVNPWTATLILAIALDLGRVARPGKVGSALTRTRSAIGTRGGSLLTPRAVAAADAADLPEAR